MSLKILDINDIVNKRIIEWLKRQVVVDPATHSYALYDIVYQLENTRFNVVLENNSIIGYILEWRGWGLYAIHVWGRHVPYELIYNALNRGAGSKKIYIHIHSSTLEPIVIKVVKRVYGEFSQGVFIDMVVDRESFKQYNVVKDVVVKVLDSRLDVSEFVEIKSRQGRSISRNEAEDILEESVYVGVFKDNKLVSIAGAIIRLRDAWIIADVYTLPEYRNRGYAKLATSMITSLGLNAGVKKIALHVNSENNIALKVYKRLGYYETSRKRWLIIKNT